MPIYRLDLAMQIFINILLTVTALALMVSVLVWGDAVSRISFGFKRIPCAQTDEGRAYTEKYERRMDHFGLFALISIIAFGLVCAASQLVNAA